MWTLTGKPAYVTTRVAVCHLINTNISAKFTSNSNDFGFLMVPPLRRADCFKRSFFNRIVPMWISLSFIAPHIT